jgi:hypothetical protein
MTNKIKKVLSKAKFELNKVAFLIHEPVMYVHYAAVWKNMHVDEFDIILLAGCDALGGQCVDGTDELIRKLKFRNYHVENFSDVVRRGHKYRYVVSNHCMVGSSFSPASFGKKLAYKSGACCSMILNSIGGLWGRQKKFWQVGDPIQYPPLQIGMKQIRFMYGADISPGWSLQSWNEMYDLFLCHGPNDAAILGNLFRGKTMIMGYPRYDDYFNENLDTAEIVTEFELDLNKKTILWMPTTGAQIIESSSVCSIPSFAKPLAELKSKYNIIVRPHPISFRNDPEYIELLQSLNYKIDSLATRDMNKLYKVVDFVLCDYGGSAFGAIYLDKNLILLDLRDSEPASLVADSSNLELMDNFPMLTLGDIQKVEELIDNDNIWLEQKEIRSTFFRKYFADNRGQSARCAADILSNLDKILA